MSGRATRRMAGRMTGHMTGHMTLAAPTEARA